MSEPCERCRELEESNEQLRADVEFGRGATQKAAEAAEHHSQESRKNFESFLVVGLRMRKAEARAELAESRVSELTQALERLWAAVARDQEPGIEEVREASHAAYRALNPSTSKETE